MLCLGQGEIFGIGVGLVALSQLEVSLQHLLVFLAAFCELAPCIDRVGKSSVGLAHRPRCTLRKTHGERDVDIAEVGAVEAGNVAIHDGERNFPLRHHLDKVFGDKRVLADFVNVDAAANLVVEVEQTRLIFRACFHKDVLPHELRHVGDKAVARLALHEHLVSDILRAAMQHLILVFGCDGNLVGDDVNLPGVEHLHHRFHVASYHKLGSDVLVAGKVAYSLIFITHGVATENE